MKKKERPISVHPLREPAIVAVVPATGKESVIRWYAKLVGGRFNARIQVVRAPPDPEPFVLNDALRRETKQRGMTDGSSESTQATEENPVGFLIADWDWDKDRHQTLLQQVAELDIPAVFVRQARLDGVRRVLVATAGGPHTLQHMWVAREISSTLKVPVRVVRMVHPDEQDARNASGVSSWSETAGTEASRLLGLALAADIIVTDDCAKGIANSLRDGDLLVMGAPSPFQIAEHFVETIPAAVARLVDTPLVLMHSRRSGRLTLRSLFWGRLARVGLRLPDKEAVIAELIDALISHNQVPFSLRSKLVECAMRRERMGSSAVDGQTAFPHIRLPGFLGVAGALAVCPDGVDFGSPDGSLAKFVFLLVTTDGFCDDYLAVLARIARRMIRPEVRDALLTCTTQAEILDVLEPNTTSLL